MKKPTAEKREEGEEEEREEKKIPMTLTSVIVDLPPIHHWISARDSDKKFSRSLTNSSRSSVTWTRVSAQFHERGSFSSSTFHLSRSICIIHMQVLFQYYPIVSLTTAIATNNSNDSFSMLMSDSHPTDSSRPLVFTVLIACCLTIIIILTILGNILVLIALYINFALRSPTHLLMGNLACADLLLGNDRLNCNC